MNKETIIIGHIGIGKTCLTEEIETQLGKNVKVTEVSISEMLEKEKTLKITNPYPIETIQPRTQKFKKTYWHKGKLKFK